MSVDTRLDAAVRDPAAAPTRPPDIAGLEAAARRGEYVESMEHELVA